MNLFPLFFFAGMIVLLWLLLIQPQRRRRQQHTQVLQALEPGDEVMTAGGLFGSVREVADHYVVLEIAPETHVRVAKSAITARLDAGAEAAEPSETPLT